MNQGANALGLSVTWATAQNWGIGVGKSRAVCWFCCPLTIRTYRDLSVLSGVDHPTGNVSYIIQIIQIIQILQILQIRNISASKDL